MLLIGHIVSEEITNVLKRKITGAASLGQEQIERCTDQVGPNQNEVQCFEER